MALFKSGNPALTKDTFKDVEKVTKGEESVMTLQGTVNKTAILFLPVTPKLQDNYFHSMRLRKELLLLMAVVLLYSLPMAAQQRPPNIVLILADDFGFECVTANGGTSYQTPHIDALAANGIRFGNCHAQPLCTPSRIQLMTGQYNVRNYKQFGALSRTETTFANLLKNAGYKTAVAGKWQLGKEKDSPQHFGFDESCLWQQSDGSTDSEGHDTRYVNPVLEINGELKHFTNGAFGPDVVSDFLCSFMEKNKDRPFFAYYPMILTHCPFVPVPGIADWDAKSPGSPTYKGKPQYFPDMVAYMDKLVEKIVAKIDTLGLGDNTIIIFTGDNGTDQPIVSQLKGINYPGGKSFTTDNGTHVPLIIRWNKQIKANTESYDLIDFSDFLPTICAAANMKLPSRLPVDGRSFLPQLLGKKGKPRSWIYSWYSRDGKVEALKEFTRNKEYKLYATGEFYCIKTDFFEQQPLPLNKLNKQELVAYTTLYKALQQYKNVRGE